MSLGSRLGMIVTNFLTMIPLFILLIASAIMSSITQNGLSKLSDQNKDIQNAHRFVKYCTITLWILFAIALLGNAFIGLVAALPYLYAMIMGVFMLVNFSVAGVFFYAANSVRNSADYKKGSADAETLFKQLIGTGIAMVISCALLFIYIFWGIHKYRKQGGLTGDIGYVSEAGMFVAPEFAPVWAAGQEYSRDALGDAYGDRAGQMQSLFALGKGMDRDAPIVQSIRQNPELMAAALKALA